MAAEKFLTIDGTGKALKSATVVSTGAPEAGKIVALDPTGKLDMSVMPTSLATGINFSYKKIDTGVSLTIPAGQQMAVYGEIESIDGELIINGELVII